MTKFKSLCRLIRNALFFGLAVLSFARPASAADPIKIGFSMALTGPVSPNGKMLLLSLEIWRDDVNAKGGLLGRPVELVFYDDQSNPSNVPGIYSKLLDIDKVDLLVGPYATNMVAPAMPVIMRANKTTIGLMATHINRQFKYPGYFSMVSLGEEGTLAFSKGWFELAAAQNPKPKTVALVAADAEFGKTVCDGTRENAKAGGFEIVYDKAYPPSTTDYAPIMRAVQATNPDLVYICAYPPDTVGIIRAMNEMSFKAKMIGGALVGLYATPIKALLGPMMNGIVLMESFVPSPKLDFPGLKELMAAYQAKAPDLKIDPLGTGFVPFGYSAGQVLAQAVEATKSLDHQKIGEYIRKNKFQTVAGEIAFGPEGEWAKTRQFATQFQGVTKDGGIDQFRDTKVEPILWPNEYKTGNLIYPYDDARK